MYKVGLLSVNIDMDGFFSEGFAIFPTIYIYLRYSMYGNISLYDDIINKYEYFYDQMINEYFYNNNIHTFSIYISKELG